MFQEQFEKSMLSIRGTTQEMLLSALSACYPVVSDVAIESLYYTQAHGEGLLQYPMAVEFSSLDTYLILYTITGQGLLSYSGEQSTILTENTSLLLHCNQNFTLEVYQSSSWNFYWMFLQGPALDTLYQQYSKTGSLLCCTTFFPDNKRRLSLLPDFTSTSTTANQLLTSKLLYDLLTSLLLEKCTMSSIRNAPVYLSEIKRCFDKNYKQSYHLDELAKQYHVSKYRLIHDFTSHYHCSPIEYLIRIRIEAAKVFLKTTNQSIYEVALSVGYDNATHFIRLFKKHTSMTPLRYRAEQSAQTLLFMDDINRTM